MARREVFVSVDVETDGPIPGPHSMLSLGAAAFLIEWGGAPSPPATTMAGTFTRNLAALPGAAGDEATMRWWNSEPAAWAACRDDQREPAEVMADFAAWLDGLPGRPVFVAYPAGFDFTWVYWYAVRFTGKSPFSHAALDMKTMAMTLLGTPFRDTTKRVMPSRWFSAARHSHVAVEDAIEQGEIFCKMMIEARGRVREPAAIGEPVSEPEA
jgi:hypothetical protein